MLFNSYIFVLCFLPISVLGYFTINRFTTKRRESLALVWLSLVSCCFYAYAGIQFLPVLVGSIFINYLFCCLLKNTDIVLRRKIILTIGITFHVSLLVYFKYLTFIFEILQSFFDVAEKQVEITAPLGISFFTFSQISYLVDCYVKSGCEKYNFLKYCTYVSFFPKLSMGPIALQSSFIPQLNVKLEPDYHNLGRGLYLFSLGLAKKVLIADVLAKIVSIGYGNVYEMNAITAIIVMLSYTFQLYFDFSGYCDMAIGIGLFFNIELPHNFNSPYRAKSISEFWERWHITLTQFFTKYLYIPLGGSRKGRLRTYLNILIIFLISGLWHGANWTFLFWGGLHGSLMVLERIVKDCDIQWKSMPFMVRKVKEAVQWLTTFIIINVAWMFFRAESMHQAKAILKRLTLGGWQISGKITDYVKELIEIRILMRLGLDKFAENNTSLFVIILLGIILVICLFTSNTNEKSKQFNFSLGKGLITTILLLWCIVSLSNISEFLYFEF